MPEWNALVNGLPTLLVKDGFLDVLNKLGLGIELNGQVVRRYLVPNETYFE